MMKKKILCVDLDGTLIRSDTVSAAVLIFIKRHPLQSWKLLYWLCRGRAYVKHQLGKKVTLDPATLPYHLPFLKWLNSRKKRGDRLVLATATDRIFAHAVADYVGIFDEILASDGKVNLRAQCKAAALTQRFGYKGYDYAGNSYDDLAVWREAEHAILVNAYPGVETMAEKITTITKVFL